MPPQMTHPSQNDLSAFSLGQLPPAEAASIERHITDCPPCCETMLSLSDDDTFVGLLQNAGPVAGHDPAIDRATEIEGSQRTSSSRNEVPAGLAEHSRYEIVDLIGRGGMGDVYRARHRMMNRTVALKVIKPELVRKPEAIDRFHREVKTAAQLSHPNIVTSHDAEQVDDVHFLVMEYVDGVDLSQVTKERGGLPIADACDYVRQAAIGLQHAHDSGMVHRDIKPHNLMLTTDGTVKILDFGLASLTPQTVSGTETVAVNSELTVAGAIMGTPDFISPEQAQDARQADIRSDIYSLGATLYFLLSGQPPFAEGSVMHKLKSHAEVEPDSLQTQRNDVPDELGSIVTKMMAKNPSERYLTPSEVAEALESFLRTWQPAGEKSQEQKPSSGGNHFGSSGPKPDTGDQDRDWLSLWATRMFYITWIPVAFIFLEVFFIQEVWNSMESVIASGDRVIYYAIATFVLSTIAGVLGGVKRFQTEMSNPDDRRVYRLKTSETMVIAAVLIGTGLYYYVQTNTGIIRIEVNDPSLEVKIKGETVTMKDGDDKSLTIRAGEQRLLVRKDNANFEFYTDGFQIRRGEQVAFQVEMMKGEILVRKDGEPFDRGLPRSPEPEKLDLPDSTDNGGASNRSVSKSKLELSPDLENNFIRSRMHLAKFEQDLFTTISRAAGIPNEEWEKTGRGVGTDAIQGTPLSKLLMMCVPDSKSRTGDPPAPRAFRLLTTRVPKPLEFHKAMAPSQEHGYVSLIQPEYILKATLRIDRKTAQFHGTLWFEAPDLYAGKVDFSMFYHVGRMKITEFNLPELGMTLVQKDDQWVRRVNTESRDDRSGQEASDLLKPDGSAGKSPSMTPVRKPVSEIEAVRAAIHDYYIDKYPLFAAFVDLNSKIMKTPNKLLDRETRRQLGELGINSPVSEVINSFPGRPYVTFTEVTEAPGDNVSVVTVDIYGNKDGTCRFVVTAKQRKKRANEPIANSQPITEEQVRNLVLKATVTR